jgi:predicted transcriptional regulator of viral defense system
MADSVYISANLTLKQLHFMRSLDDHEIEQKIGHKYDNLNEILENLVDKQIFVRIERGKFCRLKFSDENVIGCFLVPDGVISYWSALNKHGLTDKG